MNAGRCFHGKLRHRSFAWGTALMFLTTYVQGKTGGPMNNDMLVLVVEGLTHDGRYAVNGHFEIHHPKIPDTGEEATDPHKVEISFEEEPERAEGWLDSQADTSFTPPFDQYEAFLAALEIRPGGLSPARIRNEQNGGSASDRTQANGCAAPGL